MKKLFLLTFMLCASMVQAFAEQYTDGNGVTWTYEYRSFWFNDKSVEGYAITGVSNYGDDLTVPSMINGKTIMAIGYGVFQKNETLATVELPKTIKWIDGNAFQGCKSLTSVGDISNCQYVAYEAFENCSMLSEVDLTSCQYIRGYAFNNCSNLKTVGSLAACKNIESYSFYNCRNLQEIDLGKNVQIGQYAFSQCVLLNNIGSLEGSSIGDCAFNNCSSLTAVDLSKAASVGSSAFAECHKLASVGDLAAFTAITDGVFSGCDSLASVNLVNCRSIGNNCFSSCRKLKSVDLSSVVTIGESAFSGCSSLETVNGLSKLVTIPSSLFSGCSKLTTINIPNVTTIEDGAFANCTSLSTLTFPKIRVIGNWAFYNCAALDAPNITSTDLESIGSGVFNTPGTVTILSTTPAKYGNNAFGSLRVIRVPDGAVATYRAAEGWSDIKARILGLSAKLDWNVATQALSDRSGLVTVIGEDYLGQVVSLKITGSINSYDIMVLRNKMDNLHYLDMTDANIVANNYQYYTGYSSMDNVLGDYSLCELTKLLSVKLPKTITSIGRGAFCGCINLNDVVFQPGIVTIGESTFQGCPSLKKVELKKGLKYIESSVFSNSGYYIGNSWHYDYSTNIEEITLPEGLESIGSNAFYNNNSLKKISFPTSLQSIGYQAFDGCSNLSNIILPTKLQRIENETFQNCYKLTEVHIPSTIRSIGDKAFYGCNQLNDVYTYIVEPTDIDMNTFSTYTTATLNVPATSFYNYWYNTEWSQFRTLREFAASYEYFYLTGDFTIGDEKGTIKGEGDEAPDVDLNVGSGLIVETDSLNKQALGEIHLKANEEISSTIIANNNIVADKVIYELSVGSGRWYFFSFPFRVKATGIKDVGNYVFRYYNGANRAKGKTGWANWTGDYLQPGQGYIFQCSVGGTLKLTVAPEDMDWEAKNRPLTFEEHVATDEQDASWNYLGNPHHSYFDIDMTGFSQPITMWNGYSYDAVRPGDDNYTLKPFQGFFVQKPEGETEINFPAGGENDGRYTYKQWMEELARRLATRRAQGVDVSRQLINLTIGDGQTEDKTRVVFNEQKSQKYEIACDAIKFFADTNTPQLYTLDQRLNKYAINERPAGEVRLGYVAAKAGELTINAVRMDQPVLLRDNELRITHDLSTGGYTFDTGAGTFNDRFMLVMDNEVSSVASLRQQTGVSVLAESNGISFSGINGQDVTIYSISGVALAEHLSDGFIQLPQDAYIVKVDGQTTKLFVK